MCVGTEVKPRPLPLSPEKPDSPGAFALLDLKRIGAGDLIGKSSGGGGAVGQNILVNGSSSNGNPYHPKVGFASKMGVRIP